MSYQCMEAVLDSQLPAHIKLTLIALARHATPDCSTMWAPVNTLARGADKTPRAVIADLAWLEAHGVIEEVNGRRLHGAGRENLGGRNRCPRYRLNKEALVSYRPTSKPRRGFASKPCIPVQGSRNVKPCIPVHGISALDAAETLHSSAETLHSSAETLHSSAPDPKEPKEPSSSSTAAAPPLPFHPHNGSTPGRYRSLSRQPAADGNYRVGLRLAHDVMDKTGLCEPTDPDLIEAFKLTCAEHGVDYSGDFVPRVLNAAYMQRRHGVGRREQS